MKPFHTIAIPHDDILQGRLTMDVFAADLWDVSKNQGVEEYKDAEIFFKKTYLTQGLKNLLGVVEKRLRGKAGDPIVQIQTPFGGGKTHALIALYHKVREWKAKTAVIVGTHLSGNETLWEEIEKQLTGTLEICKGRVAPGSENIKRLLIANQPVLILMDEILEYATKAAGVKVGDSTIASQTMAFMQELTEAVSTLDNVSLVITLPASVLEHYDENAEKLFQQLQHITGRTEKIYTPVEENEISKIIRRRLFSDINFKDAKQVVLEFIQYAEKENILPNDVKASSYRERFMDSYPFMPDVIDVLYHNWGSFPSFQRTRGVLRLLSLVVHSLKDSDKSYISLADFDLYKEDIRQELIKHIGKEFDSVIASDITGSGAGSKVINNEMGKAYIGLKIGTRVTNTIFMYSFSGGTEHGVGLNGIKRSASILSSPSSLISEAVEKLKGRLFYLQVRGDRYFFNNQANINRILLNFMDNISNEELISIERELLQSVLKRNIFRTYIWEEDPSNIVDSEELKLIALKGKNNEVINKIYQFKGQSPRVNKNTIFFVYPSDSERPGFVKLIKRKIAFKMILNDKSLSLTDEQIADAKVELKKIEPSLKDAIRRLYRLTAFPTRDGYKEKDLGVPTYGSNFGLDEDLLEQFKLDGLIVGKLGPIVIKDKYLTDKQYVSTKNIYQSMLTTPGEMRVQNRSVLESAIAEGVKAGMFGLGTIKDEKPSCQYFGDAISPTISFNDKEILIDPKICENQREKQAEPQPPGPQPPEPPIGPGPQLPEPPKLPKQSIDNLKLSFYIPKGKISNIMGLMNYLQSKFDKMNISLNLSEGAITEQEIEDKIKETFAQMGIDYELE